MTPRTLLAYAIIAGIAVVLLIVAGTQLYRSQRRADNRRQRRHEADEAKHKARHGTH